MLQDKINDGRNDEDTVITRQMFIFSITWSFSFPKLFTPVPLRTNNQDSTTLFLSAFSIAYKQRQ